MIDPYRTIIFQRGCEILQVFNKCMQFQPTSVHTRLHRPTEPHSIPLSWTQAGLIQYLPELFLPYSLFTAEQILTGVPRFCVALSRPIALWRMNRLTHTVTHEGKRADGTHGAKRMDLPQIPEQKALKDARKRRRIVFPPAQIGW